VQLGELLSAAPAELPIWLDAGGNALPVLACLLQARRASGLLDSSFRGGFGADPIGALAADGELPCSLEVALQQLIGLARFAIEHTPEARAITCSTLGYHDAGATAVQELAFAYATAVQYLRALCDGGLSVEQASQQLSFQVAIANDLFMEVAKLRALRQGFSQIVRTSGGSARAQHTLVHALTSARTKSTRDPWVNLLRETTESFAAAVGGADAITSFGFDRPFGESSSLARRLAFNLQAILDEEAHVTQAADPGGGSYYLEQLTDELGQKAWALFQRIEHAGGMAEALRSGLVGELIAERSRERAAQIAKRKRVIVGVSEFADVQEAAIERPPRSERVHQSAASPTEVAAKSALSGLAAARSDAPSPRWVLAAIEAAAAGASLSQLSSTLAGGSEPTTSRALPKLRDAEPFEALRARADGLAAHGARPSVFLCNLGPIPDHKARSQFATGYFAAGGFATLDNDGFTDADSAVAAFERSGSRIAVLCGSDETYASVVEAIAPRLCKRGALRIVLAGRPGDHELAYRAAGVTDFIFVGSELPALLKELLEVGP
jgi:methylmalonyl-CoA mutase